MLILGMILNHLKEFGMAMLGFVTLSLWNKNNKLKIDNDAKQQEIEDLAKVSVIEKKAHDAYKESLPDTIDAGLERMRKGDL